MGFDSQRICVQSESHSKWYCILKNLLFEPCSHTEIFVPYDPQSFIFPAFGGIGWIFRERHTVRCGNEKILLQSTTQAGTKEHEVGILIVVNSKLIPLEVKNGKRNMRSGTACMIHKNWLRNRTAFFAILPTGCRNKYFSCQSPLYVIRCIQHGWHEALGCMYMVLVSIFEKGCWAER